MSNQKQIRKPADPDSSPLARFGFDLRTLRQEAGLTYAAIAERSFFSRSAVHAVDQGRQLPSVATLEAFVEACGGQPQVWLERRAALAVQLAASKDEAAEKTSLREQGLPPPSPATVGSPAEFNDGLKRLREWSGMTYRQIEELSSTTGSVRVVPSTLCGAVTRDTLPRRPLVASYLQVIGLTQTDQQAWLVAWQAIKDGQPVPVPTEPVLPTTGWLVQVPVGQAPAGGSPEKIRGRLTPRDFDQTAQAEWVIPTYLPTREIRDWRYHEGYWQDVESHPAADSRLTPNRSTIRIGRYMIDRQSGALAALLAGAAILLTLLITAAILLIWR